MVKSAEGSLEAQLEKVAKFYNDRFAIEGHSVKSVGWKDQASQFLRFDMLFRDYDASGKTILDVGCGLGDLYTFLSQKYGDTFHYIGIDISESLIQSAKEKHRAQNCEFFHSDISSFVRQQRRSIDYAVESGMLSFKIDDNEAYAKAVMTEMFMIANDGASLNFLSDQVDYQLDKNFHYDACKVLAWVKGMTRNFNLYQDYPLWEFTVSLRK